MLFSFLTLYYENRDFVIMADEVKHAASVRDEIVDDKEQLTVDSQGTVVDHGLHRQLKQRHMQMIALGGVIGSVSLFSQLRSLTLYIERVSGME